MLAHLQRKIHQHPRNPRPHAQRRLLLLLQPQQRLGLLHLGRLHGHLRSDRLPVYRQPLLLQVVAFAQLLRLALGGAIAQPADHAEFVQLAVSLRPQLRLLLVVADRHCARTLRHHVACQLGPGVGGVRLRRLQLQLRIQQLLFKRRIDHVQQHRIRFHMRAGQHAQAHHGRFGLGRNQAYAIFAGHQRARPAHLSHQRSALHGVGPHRRIHAGQRGFQAQGKGRDRAQNQHQRRRPEHIALQTFAF